MKSRLRSSAGMTMAEMLITVAIIIILMAVGFITLFNYQRSLAQIERDGYAKEIFIAAQNHLSMARGEGYGLSAKQSNTPSVYGYKDDSDEDNDGVYYLVVNKGKESSTGKDINSRDGTGTLIDVILPFASIDETVRSGGSYVISYQPKTGRVLNVFYVSRGSGRFDFEHDLLGNGEYASFMTLAHDDDDSKAARRSYAVDGKNAVLGWYGGDGSEPVADNAFKIPRIKVINDDTLRVEVTNPSQNEGVAGSCLKLIITGKSNIDGRTIAAKRAVYLKKASDTLDDGRLQTPASDTGDAVYTYYLDDITASGRHFCELDDVKNISKTTADLIAGEDIEIRAVAYSNSEFHNIAYSEAVTENSLYESIGEYKETGATSADESKRTAYISKIRHLENLEEDVSNTGRSGKTTSEGKKLEIKKAEQTHDLKWGAPYTNGVYDFGSDTDHYNGYRPISPDKLIYDGLRHSIEEVPAVDDGEGYAGIFGITDPLTEIQNLKLIDCTSTGSSRAGALAGELKAASVLNVVAYNSENKDDKKRVSIHATSGNAGGLAGNMTGGSMKYCGAALIVQASGSAGGLVGQITAYESSSAAVLKACYAGGHTEDAEYYKGSGDNKEPLYNIQGGSYAGGFAGQIGYAGIKYCYSTCSADATTAGGFAGNIAGTTIRNCYCTGLVSGNTDDNAFVESSSGTVKVEDCLYYMIVNEKESDGDDIKYKGPGVSGATALDENASTFNNFTGGTWNDAAPYDETLDTFYNGMYSFRTVTQLVAGSTSKIANTSGGTTAESRGAYFVNTHYGDWPSPEVFIINN